MIQDLLNRQFETQTGEVGIGGFKAFARIRETTNYKSTAPATFLEDGSPVQDHIINEPITITIDGSVGDVYIVKSPIEARINQVNETLGKTGIYLPLKTQSQIQKANALISDFRDRVRQVDRVIETGRDVLNFGSESGVKSDQEKFIDMMEAYHDSRTLVVIDMPFRRLTNMRITDLSITRDANNNALTFKLSAQKIRFTQPIYRLNGELRKAPAGGVANQAGDLSDKGAQAGKQPAGSVLSKIRSYF
jgi:hypothetical protein